MFAVKTRHLIFHWLSVLLVLTLLIAPNQIVATHAQSTDETSWTSPINLSNSGLTSHPAIVSDQNGIVHVLWQDDTLDVLYSDLIDGTWSQPVAIKSPFSDFAPQLIDGGDFIHAFWINKNNDTLNHSRVPLAKFGTPNSWERAKVLARGAEDFQVVYQDDKTLHLAYITSLEDSRSIPGTYYLRSVDDGMRWETAKPIYTSRYFRDLDPDLTNVSIAATTQDDQQMVYIAWNNPSIKRVYLTRSLDGGGTWETPLEVDGPSSTDTTSSPYNPLLTARNSDILLLWQSNLQSGFACTLYTQWSNDNGSTWSERTRILSEFVGCPQENVLLNPNQELTLLQTTIRDEVYMLAWDGQSWSRAFPQSLLSGFNDPLTNEPVTYRCRQSIVQSGTTIHVVGCNESGNQDVWVTSRAVGTINNWFPLTQLWEDPVVVAESEQEISSVQAIADVHGVFHLFWRQADELDSNNPQRSIYYARFDMNTLSQPARVLTSPDKMVQDFSVAYDRSRDRLAVVWTAATTGEIYYSWADVSHATSSFEWSKAVALLPVRPLFKSPNLLITPDGTIHVAYAVPVNEERGIYLTSSTDGGENWGETTKVYVVTEPDWQVIDFPIMASSGDEIIHMIWRREKIFGEVGVVGLYYSVSQDRGQSWGAAQVVSNNLVQGSWMIDGAGEGVHRFWLSKVRNESSFLHDDSTDQGTSWTRQENLTKLGENPGIASPFIDVNGWVNYSQVVETSPGNLVINQQRNDSGSWSTQTSLELGSGFVQEVTSLAAQVLTDGRLVMAYSMNDAEPAEGELPYRLYLASQSDAAVQATPTPVDRPATPMPQAVAPEPTATTTSPAITLEPTEIMTTPTTEIEQIAAAPEEPTLALDTSTGLALSGGLAILVVVAFLVYARIRRS